MTPEAYFGDYEGKAPLGNHKHQAQKQNYAPECTMI